MAVTDLTGTKWLLNESLESASTYINAMINFVSNYQENYINIQIPNDNFSSDYLVYGTSTDSYGVYRNGWESQAYRTISITGGTDATNSSLISWLQANATQVVTDLTGTRWKLNAIPSENTKVYSVGGVVQGIEGFTKIMHSVSGATASVTFSNGGGGSSASVFYGTGDTYQGWYHKSAGTSSSATYSPLATPPIIRFISGYDSTNANLIAWLQANATQLHAGNFSFGYLPIANMYFGTKKVIKAYFGNSLIWEKETPVPENALLAQDGKLFASGGGYLITTEVTLITFTFSGTTYQAEEGMTWGEWVASEYNTNGFTQRGYGIYGPGGEEIRDAQHSVVMESAKIVANATYISGGSND